MASYDIFEWDAVEIGEAYARKTLANSWMVLWNGLDETASCGYGNDPFPNFSGADFEQAYEEAGGPEEYGPISDFVENLLDHIEGVTGEKILALGKRLWREENGR